MHSKLPEISKRFVSLFLLEIITLGSLFFIFVGTFNINILAQYNDFSGGGDHSTGVVTDIIPSNLSGNNDNSIFDIGQRRIGDKLFIQTWNNGLIENFNIRIINPTEPNSNLTIKRINSDSILELEFDYTNSLDKNLEYDFNFTVDSNNSGVLGFMFYNGESWQEFTPISLGNNTYKYQGEAIHGLRVIDTNEPLILPTSSETSETISQINLSTIRTGGDEFSFGVLSIALVLIITGVLLIADIDKRIRVIK